METSASLNSSPKKISLALQGGGSHGAFTWGVLHALLADERIEISAISGASAGAVNAVLLGHGFAQHKDLAEARAAAQHTLAQFWRKVAQMGEATRLQMGWMGAWMKGMKASGAMLPALSPSQFNPLDINPLRDLLGDSVDFKALAKAIQGTGKLAEHMPDIHVCATHVKTGKAEIFSAKRLSLDAVMASACLPALFKAVDIEGEHYWDGGFSGNPALQPLLSQKSSSDLVLVQINPLETNEIPTSVSEITDRVSQLTFNASLLAQMRGIDFVNKLIDSGQLKSESYRTVRLHRIDGGEAMEEYPASSKAQADSHLIEALFELGQTCAQRWLKKHWGSVGLKSSINIRSDYLDDMTMDASPAK
jgi:NTE family protein